MRSIGRVDRRPTHCVAGKFKNRSPLETTFLIELANGYNGYLHTAGQHRLGGYETRRARSSYLAVDSAEKVSETLLSLPTEVAAEKD